MGREEKDKEKPIPREPSLKANTTRHEMMPRSGRFRRTTRPKVILLFLGKKARVGAFC